jgi:hypothetical protein
MQTVVISRPSLDQAHPVGALSWQASQEGPRPATDFLRSVHARVSGLPGWWSGALCLSPGIVARFVVGFTGETTVPARPGFGILGG